MSGPTLRRAAPDGTEDDAIRACIATAFPDNPKARADVLAWQYRDNPFGATPSWVWAEDDGTVVAHYSAYPVPVVLDGEPATACIGVDAAVAPTHQGQRLFGPLARALYDDCGTQGMPVTMCYPSNPIAVKGITSAGWLEVARLRTLVLALDDAWIGRRFHLPAPRLTGGAIRTAVFGRRASPGEAEETSAPPAGLDELWAATGGASGNAPVPNGIRRDAAWWDWRYNTPMGPYRFVELRSQTLSAAAVVTERADFGGRFAYLLELTALDGAAARSVVARAALMAAENGCAGLATVAVEGSPLFRLAKAAGLRVLPQRLEPKGLWFGFVDNAGGRTSLSSAPWSIAWGDLDHL